MLDFYHKIVQEDLERIYSSDINWKAFENKTIFITGANAMLGTYCAYFFLFLAKLKGISVKTIVLTRTRTVTEQLYRPFLDVPYFEILCQDVTNPILYKKTIDYILHFAGNASPRSINTDPIGILRANLIGTFNIMELAHANPIRKLLFASTREVYGSVESETLNETNFGAIDPMDNRSCYPESKRAAESILRSYFLQHKIPAVSCRIAHCYGPGMKLENDGRVMADFMADAIAGRNIVLKSPGDALRAFCYISDAIEGILRILVNGEPGTAYNLANETEPLPIREVAQMICKATPKQNIHTEFAIHKSQEGYCKYPRVALDISRIAQLGFSPKVSLSEGIKRTINSFLNSTP